MSCVKAQSHHFLLKEHSMKNKKHPVHTVSGFSQDSVIQVVYGNGVDLLGINQSIDLGHQDLHLAPVLLNTYPVHIPFPYWGHASASPVIFFCFSLKGNLGLWRSQNYHFGLWEHLMRTFSEQDSTVCLVCLKVNYRYNPGDISGKNDQFEHNIYYIQEKEAWIMFVRNVFV